MGKLILTLALSAAVAGAAWTMWPSEPGPSKPIDIKLDGSPESIRDYLTLVSPDLKAARDALKKIEADWQPDSALMISETLRFTRFQASKYGGVRLLESKTGKLFGGDYRPWMEWAWESPAMYGPDYGEFKSRLYSTIDPRFAGYFKETDTATIRLDEILWGGVKRDGIPPLNSPEMIAADDADYLADDNVVFGVIYNGDVRCYPKRILAWHEMFNDTLGGTPLCGVYCTLCGSLIIYETTFEGTEHKLGTSGFLYRSNKLMYDKATESLWSTLDGEPVVGPLVGKGIRLKQSHVVTTTWGEWSRRHPQTTVLSLNTGHDRNYDEGVAYQRYFSSDTLMFPVKNQDHRLKNKAEIFALKSADEQLALSADFLKKNPVYHDSIGEKPFVVLTDASGANRVYESGDVKFSNWDQNTSATDSTDTKWKVTPEALTSGNQKLPRLPAHRAFWFGWYAQYPDTRLVK